ncbi:MAG TPA: hypothetical protein VJ203_15800 [Bacteroidales bacterium]|nr:hypothetical protein [Bacteroidales bacterium]
MPEWIFNHIGRASLIYDKDCIRNNNGKVIAWIKDKCVFSLSGRHKGWFESGIFYDSNNRVIGFLLKATGHLPSSPGTSGTPGMPSFYGHPGRPAFSGIPGRPGYSGWSTYAFEQYFD